MSRAGAPPSRAVAIAAAILVGPLLATPTHALAAMPESAALKKSQCCAGDPYGQLTLSPVDSNTEPVVDARFAAASVIADFNGDGWPDLAVGAPGDKVDGTTSGTVTVFSGSGAGFGIGRRLAQTDFGAADEVGDRFGSALAAGDFNGDTIADLAVGTPSEKVGAIDAGSIAIFNGKTGTGLTSGKGITQGGIGKKDQAGDEFGAALAAGDFNGDGTTDLAVGSPGKVVAGTTARSGEVTVLRGSAGGPILGWVVNQSSAAGANETGDRFGTALAAGPVTGDRYADLVVGAPGEAPGEAPRSGAIYLVTGAADGIGTGSGHTQTGNGGANEEGDLFGSALAIGDLDRDGKGDVVVGSPGEAPGADPKSGTLTVLPGTGTGLGTAYSLGEAAAGTTPADGDRFAAALATGDANGDGFADLLVGAPGRSASAGLAFLFTGGKISTNGQAALQPSLRIAQSDVYETDESGDGFGTALALNDIAVDGRADAVVGSPGEAFAREPAAGVAVVLDDLFPTSISQTATNARAAGTVARRSAASAAACPTAPAPVAHRGGTELHLENTLNAFRSAGDAGITQWETDVRFDVMGTPVILHDETVDRVSPQTGAISRLNATTTRIPTDDGQVIPTLREVYATATTYRAQVQTELKVMPTATQWTAVVNEIQRFGLAGVTIISFDPKILLAAKERIAGVRIALLHNAGYRAAEQIREYGDGLSMTRHGVSASRAALWHGAGIRLYAWTVDSTADWSRLAKLPLDGMVTNKPIAYGRWVQESCT